MDARVKPGHDAECLARVSHRIQTCVVARVLYGPGQAVSILLPRRPEKEPKARGTPWKRRTCGYSDFSTPRCCEVSRSAGPSGPWRPARLRLFSGAAEVEDGLPGAVKNAGDDACLNSMRHARQTFGVMPGLDPGIHDELRHLRALRSLVFAAHHHGLPGQARQ